jgi:hypothetical protein
MGTDKNGLYDKEPSVMETHIGRFHHVDAHDKTERLARILVVRLLPRSLLLPEIMGKRFTSQTEFCLVDEKVHMNTARFNVFRDSLRARYDRRDRC